MVQAVALGEFVRTDPPEKQAALRAAMDSLGITRGTRNLTPEQRTAYQAKRDELDRRWPPADVSDYVNHIDHAVKVAGIDHVGVGTDFDGGGGVRGLQRLTRRRRT